MNTKINGKERRAENGRLWRSLPPLSAALYQLIMFISYFYLVSEKLFTRIVNESDFVAKRGENLKRKWPIQAFGRIPMARCIKVKTIFKNDIELHKFFFEIGVHDRYYRIS